MSLADTLRRIFGVPVSLATAEDTDAQWQRVRGE